MVDGGGLENRLPLKRYVGSNPTLVAQINAALAELVLHRS